MPFVTKITKVNDMTTASNKIRERYGELIRLLSLIGNNTKIENETDSSLILHANDDNHELLIFKLTLSFNSLDIQWKISDSVGYIGSFCFPSFMASTTIFKDITTRISEWQQQIATSKISTSIQKAINVNETIKEVFDKDWTLINFKEEFGPTMQVGISTNSSTKEKFPNCKFLDHNGNVSAFVGFYSHLGPLTAEEIKREKYNLFIGQNHKGHYYLHDNNVVKYEVEEVDLGLGKEEKNEQSEDSNPNLSFTEGHYGVNYLSINQKYALLCEVIHLYLLSETLQNKEIEVNEILDKFTDVLKLSYQDIKSQQFNQFKYSKELCDETVKTIGMDGPFILLIVHCMQLIELDGSVQIIKEFYTTLIDIGYTGEEALSICNGDFVFRFN